MGARTQPQQSPQHQIAQHRVSAQYVFATVIMVFIRRLISSSNFVRFNLLSFSQVIHCVVSHSPSCSLLSHTNIPDVLGPRSLFLFLFLNNQVQITHTWQDYHKSAAVFLLHPITWQTILICLISNVSFALLINKVSARLIQYKITITPYSLHN